MVTATTPVATGTVGRGGVRVRIHAVIRVRGLEVGLVGGTPAPDRLAKRLPVTGGVTMAEQPKADTVPAQTRTLELAAIMVSIMMLRYCKCTRTDEYVVIVPIVHHTAPMLNRSKWLVKHMG